MIPTMKPTPPRLFPRFTTACHPHSRAPRRAPTPRRVSPRHREGRHGFAALGKSVEPRDAVGIHHETSGLSWKAQHDMSVNENNDFLCQRFFLKKSYTLITSIHDTACSKQGKPLVMACYNSSYNQVILNLKYNPNWTKVFLSSLVFLATYTFHHSFCMTLNTNSP